MKSVKSLQILLLLLSALSTMAQQGATIRGTVKTSDGNPAEAVTVSLKDKGQGTTTNEQGAFVIHRLKPGSYQLQVSAVGLTSTEKEITVTGTETITIEFMLSENTSQLNEVIVNASRTNRFARTSSDYVSKMPLSNIENPQVYNTIGKELL
ncbi:MAG: carboxypeptidase-like regulatory domain-containing protein, partial [Proteobacteria bacterium]